MTNLNAERPLLKFPSRRTLRAFSAIWVTLFIGITIGRFAFILLYDNIIAYFIVDKTTYSYTANTFFGTSIQAIVVTSMIMWFPLVTRVFVDSLSITIKPFQNTVPPTRKIFEDDAKLSPDELSLSNKLRLIGNIDDRIHILRERSGLILLSIAFLLIAASLVIVFAGLLTNLDASAANNIERLTKETSDTVDRISYLADALDMMQKMQQLPDADPNKPMLNKRLGAMNEVFSNIHIPTTVVAVTQALTMATTHLNLVEKLLDTAWMNEITNANKDTDARYIIASAITRVGVVLVIVFLVQILIGLFRYNSRLVTFYSSRRDLFELWDGQLPIPRTLEDTMSPHIDFGKEPKHPLEEVIRDLLAKLPTVPGFNNTENKQTPSEEKII